MSDRYVFDSYAILALLCREPGADRVAEVLRQVTGGQAEALMSWVNVGEVAYFVERRWGAGRATHVIAALEVGGIQHVPVGRDLALGAARIKASCPMAFADTFAAALAIAEDATLMTGDPEFAPLERTLRIEWLQPKR